MSFDTREREEERKREKEREKKRGEKVIIQSKRSPKIKSSAIQ